MAIGTSAFEEVLHPITGLKADGDLTADQHLLVKMSGDGKVALAGNNEVAIGVLCNKPNDGQAATVAGPGSITKFKVGTGGVSAGTQVCPAADSSGKGVAATTGDSVVGVALQAASENDLGVMLVGAPVTVHA